ncbi:MAG: DUF4382 domain-containing protein [candidate division KSB1 bacterium]|nr:DUF4382 domain-containing protein [candidate division KSB1 bacterium]
MRYFLNLFLLFWVVAHLSGCEDNVTTTTIDSPELGTLQISLTDASANFDAVNITFSEVSAHIDGQWMTVRGEPITVNLLEWNNGKSIVIGTADLPAGHYTQIRLKIDSAEVVIDGRAHPAKVPSGAQTGLKLTHQFTIKAGSTYELLIDFDANRSIVTTGPPSNPIGYLLKPTIRVVPKAMTGSISGTVTNPQHLPIAYAIAGTDTVTSTPVNENTGAFMLAFLSEGSYAVAIRDTLALSFRQEGVEVVAGTDKNLGNITLR